MLTNGKLAEFMAGRFGDGFGKKTKFISLRENCFLIYINDYIVLKQKFIEIVSIKVSWPVFGLQAVCQVRHVEKRNAKFN